MALVSLLPKSYLERLCKLNVIWRIYNSLHIFDKPQQFQYIFRCQGVQKVGKTLAQKSWNIASNQDDKLFSTLHGQNYIDAYVNNKFLIPAYAILQK